MFKNILNIFTKSADEKYTLYKSVSKGSLFTITPTTALNLNEISLYINKGISKRSEKVGQTKFLLKDAKGKTIENHWILNLMDRPNQMQTGKQFWALASTYKDVAGFVVIKKEYTLNDNDVVVFKSNKEVKRLILLNPMYTTINYNEDGSIKSFSYTEPNGGTKSDIPFDDCIYWYKPDPKNMMNGISVLTSGIRSIDTELELLNYHNKVLKNGGVIDGIFKFKNSLNEDQLKKLKASYKQEYAGSAKAGIPLFMGGDGEYQKVGLSMQELSYLESRKSFIDDMVIITSVPLPLLGLTADQTFANADTAHRIFLRETVKPIVEDLVNVLDWRLVPKDLTLDFVDPTPEDVESKLKVIDVSYKSETLTTNERRNLLGFEPIKGGDEIISLQNKVDPTATKKKSIFVHPLSDKKFRHKYHADYLKLLDEHSNMFKKELIKYFDGQKKRLISSIGGRKQIKTKSLFAEAFNMSVEVNLAKNLTSVLKDILMDTGQETTDVFTRGKDFNYTSAMDAILDKRVDFFAQRINETTANDLISVFDTWYGNNDTLSQLVESIEDVYDNSIAKYRAEAIANTETAFVMQQAKMGAYKQMNMPIKIWSWASGIKGGVRDNHKHMDGEERPIDMPFSNGMMQPLDPNAPAGEVVNCNCSI